MAARADDNGESLRAALTLNQRLWSIFQGSLIDPACPLPKHIRDNVLALSVMMDRHLMQRLGDLDASKIQPILDINRAIAEGLSVESPVDTAHPQLAPKPVSAPAPVAGVQATPFTEFYRLTAFAEGDHHGYDINRIEHLGQLGAIRDQYHYRQQRRGRTGRHFRPDRALAADIKASGPIGDVAEFQKNTSDVSIDNNMTARDIGILRENDTRLSLFSSLSAGDKVDVFKLRVATTGLTTIGSLVGEAEDKDSLRIQIFSRSSGRLIADNDVDAGDAQEELFIADARCA